MYYLSAQEVLDIHNELVDFFQNDGDPIEPPGPKNEGLIESACERPKTGLGGYDKYQTVDEKAAAFFHSLVSNHPFHNGNKRTALVSTVWFLDQNGRGISAADEEWFEFVTSVADGHVLDSPRSQNVDDFVGEIRSWISSHSHVRNNQPVGMKTKEFLEKVGAAGGTYREAKGGSWLVRGPEGSSIRLSRSTRQLDGPAVRAYVNRLKLNEAQSGISFDEFQSGYVGRGDIVHELLAVLRQLAHT